MRFSLRDNKGLLVKFIFIFLVVLSPFPRAKACLGPDSERAQERDALLKFIGLVSGYQIHTVKGHSLVTFQVSKTLRGPIRDSWSLYFRSHSPPKDLAAFQKQFGKVIEVGAREMIAPGEAADSKKRAFYIVDSACTMNGEDWLLRKVKD